MTGVGHDEREGRQRVRRQHPLQAAVRRRPQRHVEPGTAAHRQVGGRVGQPRVRRSGQLAARRRHAADERAPRSHLREQRRCGGRAGRAGVVHEGVRVARQRADVVCDRRVRDRRVAGREPAPAGQLVDVGRDAHLPDHVAVRLAAEPDPDHVPHGRGPGAAAADRAAGEAGSSNASSSSARCWRSHAASGRCGSPGIRSGPRRRPRPEAPISTCPQCTCASLQWNTRPGESASTGL